MFLGQDKALSVANYLEIILLIEELNQRGYEDLILKMLQRIAKSPLSKFELSDVIDVLRLFTNKGYLNYREYTLRNGLMQKNRFCERVWNEFKEGKFILETISDPDKSVLAEVFGCAGYFFGAPKN